MHINKTKRSIIATTLSVLLAVLFGGLFAQSVRAVVSNPTPVCVGSLCTLTFEPTGDYYLWSPPPGSRNVSFDLSGAQGGRSGGNGGRVTGSLVSVPTALYIYVGGAGLQGSGAAGGFNGGGNAGSGRGDEGSGGGATDIRFTNATNERIAVAGGGGGSGGFGGASGGAAGGSNGSAGTSGQGQGGFGASLTSGGNGGYPNGGSWGSGGEFALGGAGGSSYVSGGGGGGGGYYGGGGGGADVDTCCSNAGGGGGGSSWTNSSQTSNVIHTSGYRAGGGLAVISYSTQPKAVTFAALTNLTGASSITYNLNFNEPVTGLTNSDFSLVGSTSTCDSIVVTGSGATYSILASGCSVGILKISLNSNSVTGVLTGPVAVTSAPDVVIERSLPIAVASIPPSPNSSEILLFGLEFNEAVTGLAVEDFEVSGAGCQLGGVSGSSRSYTIEVPACQNSAEVALSLKSNSVTDLAGNAGPLFPPVFSKVVIDRTAPAILWQLPSSNSTTDNPAFTFSFLEAVNGVEIQDFQMIGDASGCEFSIAQLSAGTQYRIESANCSYGSVQLLLQINSYQDSLGNYGPTRVSASSVISRVMQIATPPLSPAQPATPSTQGTLESLAFEMAGPENRAPELLNEEVAAPKPALILEGLAVRKTYAFASSQQTSRQTPELILVERPYTAPQIKLQNPTDPVPLANQDFASNAKSSTIGLLTTGVLSSVLAGVGLIKLARQIRGKRLVRKFS